MNDPSKDGYRRTNDWAVCDDKLVLDGEELFFKCPSKLENDEAFFNMYDRKWNSDCEARILKVVPLNEVADNTQRACLPHLRSPSNYLPRLLQVRVDNKKPPISEDKGGDALSGDAFGGEALAGAGTGSRAAGGQGSVGLDTVNLVFQLGNDHMQNSNNDSSAEQKKTAPPSPTFIFQIGNGQAQSINGPGIDGKGFTGQGHGGYGIGGQAIGGEGTGGQASGGTVEIAHDSSSEATTPPSIAEPTKEPTRGFGSSIQNGNAPATPSTSSTAFPTTSNTGMAAHSTTTPVSSQSVSLKTAEIPTSASTYVLTSQPSVALNSTTTANVLSASTEA